MLSNESKIAHAEIREAVRNLMQAANKNNAALVGFVWGANPPLLVRFGNVTETGPDMTALLLKLEDTANGKVDRGESLSQPFRPEEMS